MGSLPSVINADFDLLDNGDIDFYLSGSHSLKQWTDPL